MDFLLRVVYSKWGEQDGVLKGEVVLVIIIDALQTRSESLRRFTNNEVLPSVKRKVTLNNSSKSRCYL